MAQPIAFAKEEPLLETVQGKEQELVTLVVKRVNAKLLPPKDRKLGVNSLGNGWSP